MKKIDKIIAESSEENLGSVNQEMVPVVEKLFVKEATPKLLRKPLMCLNYDNNGHNSKRCGKT